MRKLRRFIVLMLVLVLIVLLYANRHRLGTALRELRGGAAVREQATPELAEIAHEKLEGLNVGGVNVVSLSEAEVQSLLQYKYRQLLPAFVNSPVVELEQDRIHVKARVPVERLPQVSELGEAAGFLPDTTEVAVSGQLLPLRAGRVALTVDQVKAGPFPLPRRLVANALTKLGRKDEPGLPADALALPLPSGVDAAYVRGDSLVFLSNGRAPRQ